MLSFSSFQQYHSYFWNELQALGNLRRETYLEHIPTLVAVICIDRLKVLSLRFINKYWIVLFTCFLGDISHPWVNGTNQKSNSSICLWGMMFITSMCIDENIYYKLLFFWTLGCSMCFIIMKVNSQHHKLIKFFNTCDY